LDGQTLGHDVGELVRRWDMENTELSQSYLLADKVDVNLDVLRAAVVYWVSSHVDSTHIVTVDNHRKRDGDVELLQ